MPRDYAKNRRRSSKTSNRRKTDKRRTRSKQGSPVKAYFAGLLSGVFASFLGYLYMLPASDAPATPPTPEPTATAPQPDKPETNFIFYQELKQKRVEMDEPVVEPAADVSKPRSISSADDVYILQAGSFRAREDADRRRAELLLLGLEPNISESSGDNGRWFRVYLGPFDNRRDMNRARGLTAGQNIETLLLKRPRG